MIVMSSCGKETYQYRIVLKFYVCCGAEIFCLKELRTG